MSKKIKNKILVNGKVFMPAKLNEEWLKEPARDESLKEIYNDDYFISLIPEGCNYFAIDEKNEKVYGLGFNYKEKMEKQIADLEAKLAEKNKTIEAQYNGIGYWKSVAEKRPDFDYVVKIKDLEQQLAEKDEEIEQWKSMAERSSNLLDRYSRTGEIENQDKISFAVEQLEKVKELINKNYFYNLSNDNCTFDKFEVDFQIDNQIKAIKGEE